MGAMNVSDSPHYLPYEARRFRDTPWYALRSPCTMRRRSLHEFIVANNTHT
jgi:hypothetical protein